MLRGKKILIGITGSIAAYKAAILIRLLTKAGAEVKVIMTAAAHSFITPLTLSTLSKHPVLTEFQKSDSGEWNNHVELGLWADALIIAPATGNTIGKLANGICDNLLGAVYLSARCPVFFAPAMDLDMYQHPSVKSNIEKLISFNNQVIDAEYGELASGLTGTGRMAEPEHILEYLSVYFKKKSKLLNKKVMITAGPTYEAIDPVRFIGNHSSGKMGFALARQFAEQGAEVILICGPTHLPTPPGTIERIDVVSAEEMFDAANEHFNSCQAIVLAAAVADYKPRNKAIQKIKKSAGNPIIDLVSTTDIAATLGARKKEGQIMAGFALETENELENARVKLQKKNLDLIFLNSLNDSGAGFGHDTNKITLVDKENNIQHFELKDKGEVAKDIVEAVARLMV
jgi:phosphopantothenoylcysteine decarboxylase/phosphopantothenate--cysteine ligase